MFPTTRLSVLAALRSGDVELRAQSLEQVARTYWRAVYKHLRAKWRKSTEDAEDLTQTFFAVALEKDYLAAYDPSRGRFRAYLRMCVDRFAAKDHRDAGRQKRGGGARAVSLDFGAAEEELTRQLAASDASVEQIFDDEWARALFAMALDALRAELDTAGRSDWFRLFERYELRDDDGKLTYADLGRETGLPVTTVTNRLAFARRELRRHVLEQLAAVTSSEDELRSEARALLGVDLTAKPAKA
jgi:RNA polymerase sigma factor (sigma-70 family)